MEKSPPNLSTEEYPDARLQIIKSNFLDEVHLENWNCIKDSLLTPRNNVLIDVRSDRYFDAMTVHAALDQLIKECSLDMPLAGLYSNEHKYPSTYSFDMSRISSLDNYLEQLYAQGQSSLLVTRLGHIDRRSIDQHVSLIWPIVPGPTEPTFLPMHSDKIFTRPQK